MSLDPKASLETPTVVVGDTTFHLPYADLLPPLGDNELDALRADPLLGVSILPGPPDPAPGD
ncbi:MAG: hypothetical protein ACK4QW_18470, partial [Alphaproteobacteria bacterium]